MPPEKQEAVPGVTKAEAQQRWAAKRERGEPVPDRAPRNKGAKWKSEKQLKEEKERARRMHVSLTNKLYISL